MSKILLPTVDFPPQQGGVARYLGALKKSFPDEIQVVYWNTPLSRWEMFREVMTFGRDYSQIWTSHILPIGTMAYAAKLITKTPYVVFLHGMDFDLARRSRWKRMLTKRILRGARRVVTNSESLAQEVESFAGIMKPLVVYPTVADQFLRAGEAYDPNKKELHEGGKVGVLTVSRLVQRKGHEKILKAIKKLPNVEYWIIGEGPQSPRIRMRIKDLDLEDRVHMLGQVDDRELLDYYRRADIFVMPTTKTPLDREGFGIVYLEAQLFGLPVIASDHPGVDEAVENHRGGILVNDADSLRSAIRRLVDDPRLRREMGMKGRDYVLSRFTRQKQTEKLRELL